MEPQVFILSRSSFLYCIAYNASGSPYRLTHYLLLWKPIYLAISAHLLISLFAERHFKSDALRSWRTQPAMRKVNICKGTWDLQLWVKARVTLQNILLSSLTIGITQLWDGWKNSVMTTCGQLGNTTNFAWPCIVYGIICNLWASITVYKTRYRVQHNYGVNMIMHDRGFSAGVAEGRDNSQDI